MAVRNEVVRLSLQDDFTSGMARAAAAAALLNRELNSLSGSSVQTSRASRTIAQDNDTIARSANKADSSINQLTGRLRLFADLAAILGPALVPIGAVGIPAVAGLANQLGVAALAGGTAIIAFQGVGDALKAVNEASLEPTAENLEKARIAMESLSPAAQDMVTRLQELRPVLTGLRDAAAEGLFPGVIEGLDELETRIPEVERILGNVASTMGGGFADAAESLASDRWTEFFDFLATDAPQTLSALGKTVGSLAHGMAELWMAFDPLNDDFSNWLQGVASGFDSWATGLDQTEGFREFIEYVRTTGPQVADTFAALGDAVLEIAEAAAPLGGPVLQALESIFRVIGNIADSDLGTPIMAAVTAMALLSRATKTYGLVARTAWGGAAIANVKGMSSNISSLGTVMYRLGQSSQYADEKTRAARATVGQYAGTLGKSAAVVGALAIATTGAADGMGLTNTATLGLMGTLGGPFGAALGSTAGLLLDAKAATDSASDSTERFNRVLAEGSDAMISAEIDRLTLKLNDLTNIAPWEFGKWMEAGGVGAPEIQEIQGQIEALRRSLAAPNNVGEGIAGILGGTLPNSLGLTDAAFDSATQSATEFRNSLARVSAALDGRADLRDYQAALDDFTAALQDNEGFLNKQRTGFRRTSEAGRNVEAALDGIANTALAAAESMKGMDRVRYLQQARKDFIAAARDAGLTQDAARALAREFGLVNRINAKPKVTPEGIPETERGLGKVKNDFNVVDALNGGPTITAKDNASGTISWVQSAINMLDGSAAHTYIYTHRVTTNSRGGVTSSAGGRSAPDTFATGGPILGRGTGTSDEIPIWASNGEHMWTAREVANAGGHAAVEAMRAQFRYAEGGPITIPSAAPRVNVSSGPVNVGGPSIRIELDGQQLRYTMRSEMAAEERWRERQNDRD